MLAVLNRALACPDCHGNATWRRTSRARIRQNSVIHWLECSDCRQGIVAKRPLVPGSALGDHRRAELEYQVLRELESRFPQSDEYGTLIPVAYVDEVGTLVTRRFAGRNLTSHLRRSHHSGPPEFGHKAGIWLRKLHDACPRGYDKQSLGVGDKVHYLESTYGAALAREPVARIAYEKLVEAGNELKASPFRCTWGHGDFKPENVLFDGQKYVGMDTLLEHRSAVLYDLASFLDHLLLAGRTIWRRDARESFGEAGECFLTGYGDLDSGDLHAIRWLQLYFMLCYWARSQGRDRIRAIYGNWQILPLLRRAGTKLGDGAP
jgi:hypothetical protein